MGLPLIWVGSLVVLQGSLVRVVNTFVYAPNYWLAWLVDEHTGMETQLKRILSPAMWVALCNPLLFACCGHWSIQLVDRFGTHMIQLCLRCFVFVLRAKKQHGRDAYERVERSDVMFHRPVCLLGPDSSTISKELSKKSDFSLCSNVEEVLEVCARVSTICT